LEDHWEKLGIEATSDERAIKVAYAAIVKKNKPESNPEGYATIRAAFDRALEEAKWLQSNPDTDNRYETSDRDRTSNRHADTTTGAYAHTLQNTQSESEPAELEPLLPDLFAQLCQLTNNLKSEDATQHLENFVANTWDQPVDAQRALEEDVLHWFCEHNETNFPMDLAATASRLFDWDTIASGDEYGFNNLDHLQHLIQGSKVVANFERRRKLYISRTLYDLETRAIGVLAATFDADRNRKFRRKKALRKSIRQQIDELESYAPNYLRQEITPEAIEFWRAEPKLRPSTPRERWTIGSLCTAPVIARFMVYPEDWETFKESGSFFLGAGIVTAILVASLTAYLLLRLTEQRLPSSWIQRFRSFRSSSQAFRTKVATRVLSSGAVIALIGLLSYFPDGPASRVLSLAFIVAFYGTHPSTGFGTILLVTIGGSIIAIIAVLVNSGLAEHSQFMNMVVLWMSFLTHLSIRHYMDSRGLAFFHPASYSFRKNTLRYLVAYVLAGLLVALVVRITAPIWSS